MKILSIPKKNAEEYGKWAVNPYLGCPNDVGKDWSMFNPQNK